MHTPITNLEKTTRPSKRVDKNLALGQTAVFQGLSAAELSLVARTTQILVVKANYLLLEAEEKGLWVYFIVKGTVRIFCSQQNGPDIILNIVGPGEVLGEIGALDQGGHSASALTAEDTLLLKMRRDEFCDLVEKLPTLAKNVRHLLLQRIRFSTTHNKSLAVRSVHLRVARLLLALADRYATHPDQNNVPIPLRLTQKDVIEWTHVSRRHASKHLAQFRACGVLQLTKGCRMTISDVRQLRQHCD